MQLSISLPTPTAPDTTPASSSLAGLLGDSNQKDGSAPDSFSQFLPPSKSDNSGQDTQPKSSKPTKAQEEAAAALSASLMATGAQSVPLVIPTGFVPVIGKGLSATAGKSVPDTMAGPTANAPALAAAAGQLPATPASIKPAVAVATTPAATSAAALAANAAAAKTASLSPPIAADQPAVPVAATSAPTVAAQTLPGLAALPIDAQTVRAAAMGGEKIAATPVKSAGPAAAPSAAAAKKFLSNGDKQVTDSSEPVGTPVAKVTATMPTLTNPERTPASQTTIQVASVAAPTTGTTFQQPQAQAEVTGTAKGAVEAAMTAAEMLQSGATQNSMNMQFSMGDSELNLRVEMKNGEVQATFSTNSAQLRSDLAHEWQATASGNSQSSLHQIQPVFTSSGTGSTLSSGEYAQQQGRGQNTSAEPQYSTSGGSSSSSYSSSQDEDDTQAEPAAAAAGSQYLQTFA